MEKQPQQMQVKWYGYIALIVGILFFSGVFADIEAFGGRLQALDFGNVLGRFGALGSVSEYGADYVTLAGNFRGTGGVGAQDGFAFALTLIPAVLLALGCVGVIEHLDGLNAAAKLLNPVLRPLMGVPGVSGLGLIASLQSADAGAGMISELHSGNLLSDKERLIFTQFQFTAGGTLTNFLGSGAAFFPYLATINVPILVPMATIFVFKFVAANFMRVYATRFIKEAV